jgi:hypothetical protein
MSSWYFLLSNLFVTALFRVAVHGAYKYACPRFMFLFLIKLTLFSLFRRALTVQDSNLQSRPLFSLIDSFDREALRVGLYSRCHSGAGNNPFIGIRSQAYV